MNTETIATATTDIGPHIGLSSTGLHNQAARSITPRLYCILCSPKTRSRWMDGRLLFSPPNQDWALTLSSAPPRCLPCNLSSDMYNESSWFKLYACGTWVAREGCCPAIVSQQDIELRPANNARTLAAPALRPGFRPCICTHVIFICMQL